MVTQIDVAIVGGGVAGSALAIRLGRVGIHTVVFEKTHFPRPKACGEGLLPHGMAALRAMGLPDPPGTMIEGLRYRAPSGASTEVRFSEAGLGSGWVVRRETFDAWLLGHARATPHVEVREGEGVESIDVREEHVVVNEVRARLVVGADGVRSLLHQRGRFTRTHPRRERVGYSTHVRGAEVGNFVEVHLVAEGEAYVGPAMDGESVLAVLVDRGIGFDEFLGRVPALARVERVGAILGATPLGSRVRPLVVGRALVIGDAAGSPDPATGEGMSLALESTRVAAEAIEQALSKEDLTILAAYERERQRLAEPSERLAKWILWTTRAEWLAERAVARLAANPLFFQRLVRYVCSAGELGTLEPLRLLV